MNYSVLDEEKYTWIVTLKTTYKSLKYVWEYKKGFIPLSVFNAVLQAITAPLLLVIMQNVLNSIQTNNEIEYIIISFMHYCVLKIISIISGRFYNHYFLKTSIGFKNEMDIKLMKKINELDLQDFENEKTYDVITRVQNQNGNSIILYIQNIFDLFEGSITILSYVAIICSFNMWMLFIIVGAAVMESVITLKINKHQYKIVMARTKKERMNWYINYLFTTGNAFKEIKVFGLYDFLINKYKNIKRENDKQDIFISYMSNVAVGIVNVLNTVILLSIDTYIILSGLLKKIKIGDMTTYINAMSNANSSIRLIFTVFTGMNKSAMYINIFYNFIEMPIKKDTVGSICKSIKKIEFKNVSFKYYEDQEYVLKNINFSINEGEHIKIIGRNGAGKTTLLKLISGLYGEYEGEILVNDINLKLLDRNTYFANISYLFQDFVRYEFGLGENITFKEEICEYDKNKILKLLAEVDLKEKYIDDINTSFGMWFGEKQFSTGEWQKIAICRMLWRNVNMYILDEPDAALDVTFKSKIDKIFDCLPERAIAITVTHGINPNWKDRVRVIELQKGEIVFDGTYSSDQKLSNNQERKEKTKVPY